MRLIVKKPFPYAGKRRAIGEAFEATGRDARLLCALGKARAAEPGDEEPEPPVLEPAEDIEPAPRARRQYRRRDMVAEET